MQRSPSSDRQDVDLSVAAQLRGLRDHAQKNGYIVVREYVDEAESGRVADRPEFRKMIDAAAKPDAPFQEILVWKFSRFTRKREHAVAFKSMLRRKGVRVVSITEHAEDTPAGKLLEGIIESVDEFYSENLAQDVVRGMREAASRGFWRSNRQGQGPWIRNHARCREDSPAGHGNLQAGKEYRTRGEHRFPYVRHKNASGDLHLCVRAFVRGQLCAGPLERSEH